MRGLCFALAMVLALPGCVRVVDRPQPQQSSAVVVPPSSTVVPQSGATVVQPGGSATTICPPGRWC